MTEASESSFTMTSNLDSTLVTGGAGFIGVNFVRGLLDRPGIRRIVVLDALGFLAFYG